MTKLRELGKKSAIKMPRSKKENIRMGKEGQGGSGKRMGRKVQGGRGGEGMGGAGRACHHTKVCHGTRGEY